MSLRMPFHIDIDIQTNQLSALEYGHFSQLQRLSFSDGVASYKNHQLYLLPLPMPMVVLNVLNSGWTYKKKIR